ncbi:MAG: poly-gamma-glutamate biosynthesis protein PgsC/CapC, partial [Pirellulaceae bacterium]
DRFFVILLVSVIVRGVLDGFVLPWAGQIAVDDYGINFDYRNNLHSFGLIVVALIANYFWKPGIVRGLPPLATCVAITYVAIQFVLVPYTNFNVGNFHLLYDDLTTSLMASPKAYIIVLTTAYVASWMNLRYAWDFNGILIPALLGLLWHDPAKILVSGAECAMLCVVGSYMMRMSIFRKMTIQGSRKILFFFTVCFVYRLLACHLLARFLPNVNPTDAFGFGYLLSTLMAIKINDKQKAVAMFFGTAKVSMLGAVIGSLIGFAFFCGPRIDFSMATATTMPTVEVKPQIAERIALPLHQVIRSDKTLLYEKRKRESYIAPTQRDLIEFRNALKKIRDTGSNLNDAAIDRIAAALQKVNYRLAVINDRFLFLRELSPAMGWGMYVIDTQSPEGMDIQVPAPLGEWSTLESGISLFQQFPCRTLSIAGCPRSVNFGGEADVIAESDTMYNVFSQAFPQAATVQVRGYTRTSARSLLEAESLDTEPDDILETNSRVYVRGNIPAPLKLAKLKSLTGQLDVRWNESPTDNPLRDWTPGNHVELILNRTDRRRLVAQLGANEPTQVTTDAGFHTIHQSLGDWFVTIKDSMVQQGTDQYVPAKVEEMLFMDQEVFTPLVAILSELPASAATVNALGKNANGSKPKLAWLTPAVANELSSISDAAASQNYQLTVIIDRDSESAFIAVSERNNQNAKGWGTFVFRPGLSDPFAVEVPRPLFERRSFDFGISLFERPRGAAILIAGAHPRANLDDSSDISKAANRVNLFNLVRHVLLRQLGDRPFLISQARAIQAPVEADVVIATDEGATRVAELSPLKDQLVRQLSDDRLSIAFVDGGQETAGYELGILMQATSVQVSQNKEVLSLWLSPSLRSKFREQTENHSLTAQFDACEIESVQEKLATHLSQLGFSPGERTFGTALPTELRAALSQYVQTNDVVLLLKIKRDFPQWTLTRIVDGASGQAFLTVRIQPDHFPTIVNLTGAFGDHSLAIKTYQHTAIRSFVKSRTLWLEPEATAVLNEVESPEHPTDQSLVLRGAQ